jgi:hypothetical protein
MQPIGCPRALVDNYQHTRVGPKVSGLLYKSLAKWKILRGIYSAICGEVNVSVFVEVKGDCVEK